MIYQSEHVLSVFTCSEIVKFWSSACFQSSATYHLFYLSILSFNSCVIEIQLFSYNILENFCLILPSQSGNFTSRPHTWPLFLFCVPGVCLHECLAIYFHLLLIGQLCVDLLYPPSEPLPKFSVLSFKLEVKTQTSLFFLLFCAEVPEEKLKDLRVFLFLFFCCTCWSVKCP